MYSKYQTKGKKNENNKRINILMVAIFIFSSVVIGRLFKIQIIDYKFYSALASDQHQILKMLFPKRGEIFVQDYSNETGFNNDNIYEKLYPAALNKKYNLVYAEPKIVENPGETAEKVAKILQMDKGELEVKLSQKGDPYEPIKHKVIEDEKERLEVYKFKGINFSEEYFRYYPDENIGGHIIGFLGYGGETKREGQYGIEGYFNDILAGKAGYLKTERDVGGKIMRIWDSSFNECEDGKDVVLTVDYTIQHTICNKIKEGVKEYEADSGTIIVMDPFSGAILGLCNFPDFYPEKYSEVDNINVFNNSAIFNQYEPGSTFKSITAAIALDLDKIKPDTVYNDEGEIKFGPYKIKNSDLKAHGIKTMTQVMEESLNTGAIFMAEKVGKEKFKEYVEKFGFGRNTGIELDTEAKGDVSSLEKNGETYMATASFGQGISVTPIQMVSAYAALSNGGKLYKPYIVDMLIKDKKEITKTYPKVVHQVISERASSLLSAMLVSVVDNGHSKRAGVKGYYVAGKTGTAQVAENGIYGKKTIHSFIGFAPIDEPKFVMLVKMDNVKKYRFAEGSAAVIFGQIAEFLLNYYAVPPSR